MRWKRAGGLAGAVALVLAAACGSTHESEGLVLAVDRPNLRVTVSHDPIPGVMEAMVMPFSAASADVLRDVQPGDRIAFRLRVRGGTTSLDRIRILSASAPSASTGASAPAIPVGAAVPEFTLTDQRGTDVTFSALKGRVIVVSFIYTRCPLPDYCPRVMTNLTALRDRFRDRLGEDLVLLTVTFDPTHDTPDVLRAYAQRYGADVPGWYFLTGPLAKVGEVCAALGVEFYPEEGMITHTLQTAVIDRAGILAARAEGRAYSARQLGDLVDSVLAKK